MRIRDIERGVWVQPERLAIVRDDIRTGRQRTFDQFYISELEYISQSTLFAIAAMT